MAYVPDGFNPKLFDGHQELESIPKRFIITVTHQSGIKTTRNISHL
ncbi:MAG: hypothetical protein AAFX46_19755 [Cyanobacteria bacterium J06636_27]